MTMTETRIEVGPIANHAPTINDMAQGGPIFAVTDPDIWALHGERLSALLPLQPHFVPVGEEAKSWEELQRLVAALAAANHPRHLPLLAIGGGSVGDLTGFAASIYRRGCPVIHLPTTLLAQVDSAVGGKTAIDAEGEKNLVGTFHLPTMVVADPAFLATLDKRQMRAGLAEVIKYGAIGDRDFFDWTRANLDAILAADTQACAHTARHCIAAKQAIVASDLHDLGGQRALLNFGHTFGHAIESVAGLGTVLHGEGVALGMVMATSLSEQLGLAADGSTQAITDIVKRAGLPTTLSEVGLGGQGETLLPYMLKDKKNRSETPMLILLRSIGDAFTTDDVSIDRLSAFLATA